jgi:hypothetical protein
MIDDIILYTGLNVGLTPSMAASEKPEGEIYLPGIPIFVAGSFVYDAIKHIPVIEGQKKIFLMAWQMFIDSLLFDSIAPCVVDGLLALGATVGSDVINDNM